MLFPLPHLQVQIYSGPLATYYLGNWQPIKPKIRKDRRKVTPEETLKYVKELQENVGKQTILEGIHLKIWQESTNGEYKTIRYPLEFIDYIKYYEKTSSSILWALMGDLVLPIDKDCKIINASEEKAATTLGFFNAINKLSDFYFKKDINKLKHSDKIVLKDLPIDDYGSNFLLNDQLLQMLDLYKWSLKYNYPIVSDY